MQDKKFGGSVVVLCVGDDWGQKGIIEYRAIEAYDSIELALNSLYEEYISEISEAQLCNTFCGAHIGQDSFGDWYYTVVKKRDYNETDVVRCCGELRVVDLITH